MSTRMFGLLGLGVLLLGTAFTCVFSDRAQGQNVALSDETMAQLTGGADVRKALFQSGTNDPDTLTCPIDEFPDDGCSDTDWEKRKYSKCVPCRYGETKYTPTPKHWYRRLNECYTTSEGCKRRVSKQSTKTVCHTPSGTCF